MSRSRLCRACGDFHDIDEDWPLECAGHFGPRNAPNIGVIRDLNPYRSMIDGSIIDGRARHRDHLKAHGCIEIGNEKQHARKAAPIQNRRESLHRMLADVSDRDIRRIVKNELKERR